MKIKEKGKLLAFRPIDEDGKEIDYTKVDIDKCELRMRQGKKVLVKKLEIQNLEKDGKPALVYALLEDDLDAGLLELELWVAFTDGSFISAEKAEFERVSKGIQIES